MLATMARKADKSKQTGSRHKPRRMIAFKVSVYDQLAKLAERNHRPIAWEAELLVIQALTEAGLWPPEKTPEAE